MIVKVGGSQLDEPRLTQTVQAHALNKLESPLGKNLLQWVCQKLALTVGHFYLLIEGQVLANLIVSI